MPGEQGIDPGEAAEFRRRLDHQASVAPIPLAGPDAPADQGPAIKAVWEPEPPEGGHGAPQGSRRNGRRGAGHGHTGPADAARSHRKRRRMTFIAAGLVAALGFGGYSELSGEGPSFVKGAATTILPPASPSSDTGQSMNSSIGNSVSLTNKPTTSASASATASTTATPSVTASGSTAATALPSPGAGPSTPPDGGSPSAEPSSNPTPQPSPTPKPTHTQHSCFLIFCS